MAGSESRQTDLPSVYSRLLDLVSEDVVCLISEKKKLTRQMVGKLVAFDRHLNVVLTDAYDEVINKVTDSKQKRKIDVVMIRGVNIISISAYKLGRKNVLTSVRSAGSGRATAAGRGNR